MRKSVDYLRFVLIYPIGQACNLMKSCNLAVLARFQVMNTLNYGNKAIFGLLHVVKEKCMCTPHENKNMCYQSSINKNMISIRLTGNQTQVQLVLSVSSYYSLFHRQILRIMNNYSQFQNFTVKVCFTINCNNLY